MINRINNPLSFAFAMLNEALIKPTIQGIKDDWNKGLEEDFEIIYKPEGLEACKAFVDQKRIITPFDYIDIFTPTLKKLLKNEFLSIDEVDNFNQKIQLQNVNLNDKFKHTIFYKYQEYKYGLDDDAVINCIFINDIFLNK